MIPKSKWEAVLHGDRSWIKAGDVVIANSFTEAHADRIVACVNACDGINPEAVYEMFKLLNDMLDWDGILPHSQKRIADIIALAEGGE